MVDISTTINVDVLCSNCGGTLNAEHNSIKDELVVDLCDDCLQAKHKEGYDEGYGEGYEQGQLDTH